MSKPDYLDQLITAAMRNCGSDAELARKMGVQPPAIAQWRSGARTVAVQEILLMAHIAELQPEAWAARHIVWKYRDSPRGPIVAAVLANLIASDWRGERFKWTKRHIR